MLQLKNIHSSWRSLIQKSLEAMDPCYLNELASSSAWLPGPDCIFNAFSIPVESLKVILWGESPYPRAESANGYAFWDNSVIEIWNHTGLSKQVNKATSLRNLIKMLLVARGDLQIPHISQSDILLIKKDYLIKTLPELFNHFLNRGFLLLNASLVLSQQPVSVEVKYWIPFIKVLLKNLSLINNSIQLILFGGVARLISNLPEAEGFPKLIAEHPYNISFIQNQNVIDFFKPLDLLRL